MLNLIRLNRIEPNRKVGKGGEEFNGSIHKKVDKSKREGRKGVEKGGIKSASNSITHLVHRSAPKIIVKDIFQRRVRSQVSVILDRGNVIENEAAIKAVQIDGESAYGDDRRECSPRRHSHHK